MKRNTILLPTLIVFLLLAAANSRAITKLHIDDFEDGTVMGWSEGSNSINPPSNVATGGPAGVDDNYLSNDSRGGAGPGSKMVMFNTNQWTGNYIIEGVTKINSDMANIGGFALSMRIAIQGSGTRYGSTVALNLPVGTGQWQQANFGLTSSDLSLISGSQPLSIVLTNVDTLRILSSTAGPAWNGDAINATLGVDNIIAVPESFLFEIYYLIFVIWLHRH